MEDKITKEKIDKYRDMTTRALELAKKHIIKGKEKESYEIVAMVTNYLSDSKFFENTIDHFFQDDTYTEEFWEEQYNKIMGKIEEE